MPTYNEQLLQQRRQRSCICCFAVLFVAAGVLRCNAPLRRPSLSACAIVCLFVLS
jgi:hypothetical protein